MNESIPLRFILFFVGFLGVMLSTNNLQRQYAVWAYANHPDQYSLKTFEIKSVELRVATGSRAIWHLQGQINGREVRTKLNRHEIPKAVLENLQKQGAEAYHISVLFAPSSAGKYDGDYSINVLEPSLQGTTVSNAIVEIALWNVLWILCSIGWVVVSVFRWRLHKRLRELNK